MVQQSLHRERLRLHQRDCEAYCAEVSGIRERVSGDASGEDLLVSLNHNLLKTFGQ